MQASRARMGQQTNILVEKTADEVAAMETYISIESEKAEKLWKQVSNRFILDHRPFLMEYPLVRFH